ncbi:MAG: hypothetical protein Q8S33_06325 [Myxococcales bacterium]|nr:hypothetical protein [Myxococcales bacterium]
MKPFWILLVLAACPPPEPSCRTGRSVRPSPTSLLLVAGVPQSVVLVLDGPDCRLPEGVLNASPRFSTPSGEPATVAVDAVRQGSDRFGPTVEVELTFPALGPGTHFLQLFLEPSLSALQRPVFVAADRRGDAGFAVTLPEPCVRPARTTAGTQFCGNGSTGRVVSFRDGQRRDWPGVDRVLTAGAVVWAIGGSSVERHEERPDGGLALTASATMTQTRLVSWADELSAIVGGDRYDFDADAGALSRRALGGASVWRWSEGARVMTLSRDLWCDENVCRPNADRSTVLGLDSSFLWLVNTATTGITTLAPMNDQSEFTTIRALSRPFGLDAGDAFTLPIPAGFQPRNAPPEFAAGWPPLLSSSPDAGRPRNLLLTQRSTGTSFDVLGPDLLGASRDFLFFAGASSNELKVIPLPLSP